MAFQQPQQRPQALRQVSFAKETNQTQSASPPQRRVEESQEWILFSPQSDRQSQTTSQTPRTATDFGSLETHVRSQAHGHSVEDATCVGTEIDDENAELDSLDDGLHAFHRHPFSSSSHNPLDQSGGTVLPTHDGLGAFSSGGLQEQLWQFERHNPHRRRHARRRSSLQRQLDEVEEEVEVHGEDEKTARIEKWRLEQSRAVLEEIERETRRRRRRMSRMSAMGGLSDLRADTTLSRIDTRVDSVTEETKLEPTEGVVSEQSSESWWQRLTRRVIHDLIGIDENTLSVIFGEQLIDDPSPTPTQPSPLAAAAAKEESRVTFHDSNYGWEVKLLDRIAKELGVLLHAFAEHDGRAFSTYQRLQEIPEYAGVPIPQAQRQASPRHPRRRSANEQNAKNNPDNALSIPTLPQAPVSTAEQPTDSSLWGIEEEAGRVNTDQEAERAAAEQAYWEKDVDVTMIFSYLRGRFAADAPPEPRPAAAPGPLPASWVTGSASALGTSFESLRRAEVIRRQHPLVSKAAERAASQARRRESLLKRHHMQQLAQKRPGDSSCASQSTKRSRRTKSGSSRHYWDLGGSVGSMGSGPAMSSGLGGWGEV
ncbi:hypothetical protein Tdes44962_MAKER02808 [Teratosphaeria destructans]|uniref:Uncharacterized protein n=1 Tax=Teratosphaeria destructans TaxID=418781 RepID=A0A9W7SS90_9PEZI|nr:hypothetical protein Tdes44962_MAKER02808 [Teratosphaeria destructans]